MGRTKKFISKDEGQKFYLVHRSQTDEAYTTDGKPSDFVLIKAGGNGNDRKRVSTNSSPLNIQDHITPLGFKNDGYDYSQHLKVMGGGRFVGRNGKSMDLPYQDINLPADAFPSDIEVPRNLQAITIDHELMDEDIRDALFGNNQEDFEELADDFITEALKEPEQPDFDYEAHIANLLLKSERSMGIATAARGWDNNDDDLEEFEYEDDEEFEESHRRIGHSSTSNNNKNNVEKRRVSPNDQLSETTSQYSRYNSVREEERQERLDEQLDAVLEEYEEEEIGDLDEVEGGAIDIYGTNDILEAALDEFLQDKKDHVLAEGVSVKKGSRVVPAEEEDREPTAESAAVPEIDDADATESASVTEEVVDIATCQEYLRETRVELEWDCESILSTYSTLDNHPSLIKIPSKNKKKKEQTINSMNNVTSSTTSNTSNFSSPTKIVLSQRNMLPKGYNGKSALRPVSAAAATQKYTDALSAKVASLKIQEEDDEVDEDDNDEATIDSVNRSKETLDEKKARKAKVKESQRLKRVAKKQLKEAYLDETARLSKIRAATSGEVSANVSVFRYS